jgi:hypothetical protein
MIGSQPSRKRGRMNHSLVYGSAVARPKLNPLWEYDRKL